MIISLSTVRFKKKTRILKEIIRGVLNQKTKYLILIQILTEVDMINR